MMRRLEAIKLILEKRKRITASDCWEYTGPKNKSGYGILGGKIVSRLAFEIYKGELNNSALHKCDNPACFNPEHLYDGTQADNVSDMIERNRFKNNYADHNINKTHCANGHEFSGHNLILIRGERRCRQCHNEQARKAWRRNAGKPRFNR